MATEKTYYLSLESASQAEQICLVAGYCGLRPVVTTNVADFNAFFDATRGVALQTARDRHGAHTAEYLETYRETIETTTELLNNGGAVVALHPRIDNTNHAVSLANIKEFYLA